MSDAQTTLFANGLRVVSEEDHTKDVVALQAWVDVGAADEDEACAGIAHLHEHMLFKGTHTRGVGEIARRVEASGGKINAWTSFDQTVYHLVLPADQRTMGVDLLADVLQNAAFDPDELAREIEVVVEEIRRADDNPSRRCSNALFRTAFAEHPYRRPVLGTTASVRGLTRERILAFYHANYRPDRITLVAVGAFAQTALLANVEAAFGKWRGAAVAEAKVPRPKEPPQAQARTTVMKEPVKEARIAVAWHIPALRHADTVAIDALALALGYGDSSRLFLEVRQRLGLVNDVYAHAYTPQDPGLFLLGAGLKSENATAALTAMLQQTYRLRQLRLSETELDKIKMILLSDSAYQRETVQGQARKLGFFAVVAGDPAYEDAYLEALQRLQPDDLRRVAERYLNGTPSVVLQLPEDATIDDAAVATVVSTGFARAQSKSARKLEPGPLDVAKVVLESGATLLLRRQKGSVVAMRAAALGGLRWEAGASCGLGHLFAAVWGLASEDSPAPTLARRVALLGGSLSAFAGRNSIGLRGEFVREKGMAGLHLFCDALRRPAFHQSDVERERAAILEGIRNREDNPASVGFDAFAAALYPTHPYGLRLQGTEDTVQGFALTDLQRVFATYASPDKLVVCVVGDIDLDAAYDRLTEELETRGELTLPPLPPRDLPPTAPVHQRQTLDRQQSHVFIGGMGTTVFDDERLALEVLCTVLSGQSGRLFTDLRDKRSLAYAISCSSLEGLDPGHVLVYMGTSPDKLQQALDGIYHHLERVRQERVSTDELHSAQRYLVGTHAIDLQRCGAQAMTMVLQERLGIGYGAHALYAEKIMAVTGEQVRDVAQRYLDPEHLVEVVIGP